MTLAHLLGIILFVASIIRIGVPALRHDWYWPVDQHSLDAFVADLFYGWLPAGIGQPNPYPSGYLVALPIAAVGRIFGPFGALVAYLLTIAAVATAAVRAFERDGRLVPVAAVAAQLFVLFNPWTYSEMVAGHYAMVLAYAGALWYVAAIAGGRDGRSQSFGVAVAFTQLQIFVPVAIVATVRALRGRGWLPALTGLTIAVPTIAGIACDVTPLLRTNYILAWQMAQSVPPLLALQLRGYFTSYDRAADVWFTIGMGGISFVTIFALCVGRRHFIVRVGAVVTVLVAFVAMGLYGPFAVPYRYLVLHVPVSGLYRELYDVVGFVAIGELIVLILGVGRERNAAIAWCAASIVLAAAWIAGPPSSYWIRGTDLPSLSLDVSPRNSRYALSPAFAPLAFRGRGSGGDPDLFAGRSRNVTPLNEALATYPVDAAFGRFAVTRDAGALASLGVGTVFERPWFSTDAGSLRPSRSVAPTEVSAAGRAVTTTLHAEPELTESPVPALGALDARWSSRAVFFGDVAGLRGPNVPAKWRSLVPVDVVRAPNVCVSATCGWVPAALTFSSLPALAQGLGGAFTRSTQRLALPRGRRLLVSVDGRLIDDRGRLVARSTQGYRWVWPARDAGGVRCEGSCTVVAVGSPPPGIPLEPPVRRFVGIPFHALTPWFVVASVPAARACMLRYTIAYDRGWLALDGLRLLPHFRADAAFDGWIVPDHPASATIYLCNATAALQCFFEVIGMLWVVTIAVMDPKRLRADGQHRSAGFVTDEVDYRALHERDR